MINLEKIRQFEVSIPTVEDNAMKLVIEELYARQNTYTWTSVELCKMYTTHGGILTRKKMLSNLVTEQGNDIVVANITGSEPVVGFRQLF